MRCVSVTYFKDSRDNWHPPGEAMQLSDEEYKEYEEKGFVKLIQTRMVEQPQSRRKGKRGRRKTNA